MKSLRSQSNNKYYSIYKPFRVLSQFTSENGKLSLSDVFHFDKDIYSVGRLDFNRFGIIMVNTTPNEAYLWAEKIRKAIAGTVLTVEDKKLSVTISCVASIGWAAIP